MRLRIVASLAAVAVIGTVAAVLVIPSASASDCATAWNSTAVYTSGMSASYNSHNYQAKWWTQNENPATNTSGVWADQGSCGGGTDPTPTTTQGGSCAAAWDAAAVYTGGLTASYNSRNYKAK